MSVASRASASAAELRARAAAVRAARRKLMAKNRRRVQRAVAVRQFNDTVREVTEALVPIFVEQGRSIADRIREVQVPASASELVRLALDPSEWRDKFVDRLLPILARRMAEAGAVHLLTYGIDVRKMPRGKRSGRGSNRPEIAAGRKATTASGWLAENADDWDSLEEVFRSSGTPMGILTEVPEWMKKIIAKRLGESFSQDYWSAISEATMGDAERVLRQGLTEGWSVAKMSRELRHYFEDGGFRYARFRAENIARTEGGNALNSARKDSVARLQQELGDRVPMKQTWHSVLGNTTRATHAMLDGVPEDKDGMWELSGHRVPWPGHYSLPVEERANCQCTVSIEFGMREEEAQAEIEEYFARVEEYSAEREEAEEASAEVRLKYDPDQPRDEHGRWTSGGGGGGGGGERPRCLERYEDPEEWNESLTDAQWRALGEWIGPSYEEMREADKEGTYNEDLENLLEALETAPLYKGPIHRRLRYDLGAKRGGTVTLEALSSFSTNPEVAKKFAVKDPSTGEYLPQDSVVSVISLMYHRGGYRLPKVEVDGVVEDEVLMERGRKLQVVKVENTVIEREGMRWKAKIYHVEEQGIFDRWKHGAEENASAAADGVKAASTRERRRLPLSRFAEDDPSYIRVEEPNDEAEERTIGAEQEKAKESPAATQLKYDPDQPRDDLGRFSSGGGGGGGSGGGGSRAERAKRTHKPSTREKQRRGRLEQDRLAKQLGGRSTPDNDAFDVLLGRHAIEVKTIMDNRNNKVTVHPSSRRRKLAYERKHGVKGHLVAIDVRGGKREYYYRDSVGSYKLSAMERVSLSELKRKLGA